jgi:hypothetical protein
MIKCQRHIVLLVAVFLASVMCSCKGGRYSSKVSTLHKGMSSADVVAALGKPYGEANGMMVYYDAGADTILAVQPNEQGECGWLLLEVPPPGISEGFAYYKVRDSSSGAPAAIGTTIFRVP